MTVIIVVTLVVFIIMSPISLKATPARRLGRLSRLVGMLMTTPLTGVVQKTAKSTSSDAPTTSAAEVTALESSSAASGTTLPSASKGTVTVPISAKARGLCDTRDVILDGARAIGVLSPICSRRTCRPTVVPGRQKALGLVVEELLFIRVVGGLVVTELGLALGKTTALRPVLFSTPRPTLACPIALRTVVSAEPSLLLAIEMMSLSLRT